MNITMGNTASQGRSQQASRRRRPWGAILGGLSFGIASSWGTTAIASTLELEVLPRQSAWESCPDMVIAHETGQPYFEGGYAIDGMVKLLDIASDIELQGTDDFSATWVGTLNPEYADCYGTAGITRWDGEYYDRHSYLRLQFKDGQVFAILDMTGMSDANGLTTVILESGLREGNPRWTWGGTD